MVDTFLLEFVEHRVGRADDFVEAESIADEGLAAVDRDDAPILAGLRADARVAGLTLSLLLVPAGPLGTTPGGPVVSFTEVVLVTSRAISVVSLPTDGAVDRLRRDTEVAVEDHPLGAVEVLPLEAITVVVDGLALAQGDRLVLPAAASATHLAGVPLLPLATLLGGVVEDGAGGTSDHGGLGITVHVPRMGDFIRADGHLTRWYTSPAGACCSGLVA